jgi:Spy/CpxP family protein refolding chaperone
MNVINALAATAVALTLGAGTLPAQDTLPRAPWPRARLGIHPPGTGLQPGVTPMHQRLGFNQAQWGARGLGVGYGIGAARGVCCGPRALLAQRGFLGLSDDQVAQLEGLNTELTGAQQAAWDAVRTHQQELSSLWAAEQPDAAAIRQRTEQLLQAQQDAQLAATDAVARARGVLSAEQQGRIAGLMQGQRIGVRRGAGMRGAWGGRAGRTGMWGGRPGARGIGRGSVGYRRLPRAVPPRIQ